MKSFVNAFASLTIAFVAFAFFSIAISACKGTETATPDPEPTGWGKTEFTPVNEQITGDHELTATLCGKQPQDLAVSVWYFPADADPSASVNSITNPGLDDDGQPEAAELPSDIFDVQVKFTEADGVLRSHYDVKAAMKFYLDENQLAVLQVADEVGTIRWITLKTVGPKSATCFAL